MTLNQVAFVERGHCNCRLYLIQVPTERFVHRSINNACHRTDRIGVANQLTAGASA